MIRRAGLVGDVHGQLAPLRAALDFLRARPDLDALFCTGDLPERGEPLLTDASVACCRLLRDSGVRTVRGNHDRWKLTDHVPGPGWAEDEGFEFLASLPPSLTFTTPLGEVMLCHGIGSDDMDGLYRGGAEGWLHSAGLQKLDLFRRACPSVKLILAGHTHLRMVETFEGVTIVNAGSLDGIKGDPPTVTLIDFEEGLVEFYDIDGKATALAETHPLRR